VDSAWYASVSLNRELILVLHAKPLLTADHLFPKYLVIPVSQIRVTIGASGVVDCYHAGYATGFSLIFPIESQSCRNHRFIGLSRPRGSFVMHVVYRNIVRHACRTLSPDVVAVVRYAFSIPTSIIIPRGFRLYVTHAKVHFFPRYLRPFGFAAFVNERAVRIQMRAIDYADRFALLVITRYYIKVHRQN